MLRLGFYGGAGKVTGSNFLVEGARGKAKTAYGGPPDGPRPSRVLVDCGIEQGDDFSVEDAYKPFPYDAKTIDALIVTHAHLDHVGRIPKLVKDGFHGKIFMTPPTKDLAELILRDSARILGADARRRGLPPLYEDADVDRTFALTETLSYHVEQEVAPGLSAYLRNTGHILGSASVRLRDEEGSAVALTGDIGNSPSPLLPDWEAVPDADALVMESVYGDRLHPPRAERVARLLSTLRAAIARGGTVLIPAFSLERTQLMLYELSHFFAAKELPELPIFLDSPLAIKVTALYDKWGSTYFKKAAEDEMGREGSLFSFPFLTKTLSREASEGIEKVAGQKIIIAGAGMSHGGRIGRWEAKYLPRPETTLIIVGYQAPGSPGRRMQEGAPRVRLGGQEVEVRAKVEILEGWSGHADRDELMKFAEAALGGKRVQTIFTALGEPASERFLAQRIHDYLGARAVAAQAGAMWEVRRDSVRKV